MGRHVLGQILAESRIRLDERSATAFTKTRMNDDLRPEDINPFASDIFFNNLVEEYVLEEKPEDRAIRIARMRILYEKYKGEDDVVSFKELEELQRNEPEATKVHTKY